MGFGILVIGFCVGSFLNVAIHRIPRGLSVNEPKRSFCPFCKASLPWWQNLPIITWLLQRGKCKSCQAPIAVRYLLVEVLTGLLYFWLWKSFDMHSAILGIVLITILITVTFIDAEHQIIPISWTTGGSLIALAGGFLTPWLLDLSGHTHLYSGVIGLRESVFGWVAGFGALWLTVVLGKLVFGRKKIELEEATRWKLQEGFEDSEQLHWLIEDEAYSWDDLFFRESDVLQITGHGFKVDGKRVVGKEVLIRRDDFSIGEKIWTIEALKSLEGKATRVVVPREAMGMGDPHLLGMIGAFLGWPAVCFVIFASSLYGIAVGLLARVGFGKPLPFGPFLAAGALTWVFGGWRLWKLYWESVGF